MASKTLRAAVFINWSMPLGFGHVGWGFEVSQGYFWFGAVELTSSIMKGKGDNIALFNDYATEKKMVAKMKSGDHGGSGFIYHAYKFVKVRNPNVAEPLKIVATAQKNGYGLLGNNCMDATFRVIKAYANGDDKILPWPATHWAPRTFFADIPSPEITIQAEKKLFGFF